MFHHSPSSIVTDWVQNIPRGWYRGWRGVIARLDLMSAPEPSVPRKFRLATINRNAARAAMRRILAWEADRLVFAHGSPVDEGGTEVLRSAFHWLVR